MLPRVVDLVFPGFCVGDREGRRRKRRRKRTFGDAAPREIEHADRSGLEDRRDERAVHF